jgi:hypothetical protein
MTRTVFAFAVLCASMAQAETAPCVSPTFDVAFPGATDVTSHVTDLPSSTFPAFWQEGRLDGYPYKIFANATGVLRGDGPDQVWAIDVMCDASAETCAFTETGTPPEPAGRVAERIAHCLVPAFPLPVLAEEPESVEEPTPLPEPNVPEPIDTPVVQEDKPCGLALSDEETEVATMQRLLVLIGEDPGPVDGFLGPQSFAAMADYTDDPGWDTSVPDLIVVLDELHCARMS